MSVCHSNQYVIYFIITVTIFLFTVWLFLISTSYFVLYTAGLKIHTLMVTWKPLQTDNSDYHPDSFLCPLNRYNRWNGWPFVCAYLSNSLVAWQVNSVNTPYQQKEWLGSGTVAWWTNIVFFFSVYCSGRFEILLKPSFDSQTLTRMSLEQSEHGIITAASE